MKRALATSLAVATLATVALSGIGCSKADADETVASQEGAAKKKEAATLRVPILEEIQQGKKRFNRLMAERNPAIKQAGLPEVPEFVTLDAKTGSAPFMAIFEKSDAIAEKLGLEDGINMVAFGDGSELEGRFGKSKSGICYTGEPKDVIALVQSLTDSVFSDQFVLQAWKHKTLAFDAEGKPFAESDMAEFEESFPDVWKEWRGKGDAILMLSSTSDGGEESNPTILRKCR